MYDLRFKLKMVSFTMYDLRFGMRSGVSPTPWADFGCDAVTHG